MNYAKDLWDEFDLLETYSKTRRSGAEEFLQILRERVLHEAFYARGLDRIAAHEYVGAPSITITPAILAMKKCCEDRSASAKQLAETITVEMIEPMKELLKSQALSLKRTSNEASRIKKEVQVVMQSHSKAYSRFTTACKTTDHHTYLLEQGPTTEQRNRLISTLVLSKKEMDESEREYHNSVKRVNDFKIESEVSLVSSTQEEILETYQSQELNLLNSIKKSLQHLAFVEDSLIQTIPQTIADLQRTADDIDPDVEIKSFVSKYRSGKVKPQ